MKTPALILAFVTSASPFAQSLGTKKDVVSSATNTSPIVQPGDLFQMVIALVIVGALVKWILPKMVTKLSRRVSTPLGSSIKVEETATIGANQLQVVTVRGRTLLLGLTTSGVNCLADLTVPSKAPDQPAFFDVLDAADPNKAFVTEAPDVDNEDMSMQDAMDLIAAAQSRIHEGDSPLDRLNRLTGLA